MSDEFETRPGGRPEEATRAPEEDRVPVTGSGNVFPEDRDPVTGGAGGLPDDPDPLAGSDDRFFGDPLRDDHEDDDAETAGPLAAASPSWVGTLTGVGLGLVLVQALVLFGTVAQGMAVARFQGDFFHKIGVALLSNVGSANGLILLVAAVLAGLPSLLRAPVDEAQRRRQALVFGVGTALAVLLVVGTPLAVRARIHVLDVGGQAVDSLARRVLATYVAGTLGTALVALGACLGLSRHSKTVTPRP